MNGFFFEITGFLTVQKLGRTKVVLKVGKISSKNDILTVQEKEKVRRVNEENPWNYSMVKRYRGARVEGLQDMDE